MFLQLLTPYPLLGDKASSFIYSRAGVACSPLDPTHEETWSWQTAGVWQAIRAGFHTLTPNDSAVKSSGAGNDRMFIIFSFHKPLS